MLPDYIANFIPFEKAQIAVESIKGFTVSHTIRLEDMERWVWVVSANVKGFCSNLVNKVQTYPGRFNLSNICLQVEFGFHTVDLFP